MHARALARRPATRVSYARPHASMQLAPTHARQSLARAEHGVSCCVQLMRGRHDTEPLNLPARAQESHVGLRGRHAAERRRREVDIGLLRSGG